MNKKSQISTEKKVQNRQKRKFSFLQMPDSKGDISTISQRPIDPKDTRSAKRLYRRLIVACQKGEINSAMVRNMTALLSGFISVCKETDFEKELNAIKAQLKAELEKESDNANEGSTPET